MMMSLGEKNAGAATRALIGGQFNISYSQPVIAQDIAAMKIASNQGGWGVLTVDPTELAVTAAVQIIAQSFGECRRGRAKVALEVIAPVSIAAAHPRSLSRQHGKSALPLHVEASHRRRPCRFIVLGCIDAGHEVAATTLLNRAELVFSDDQKNLLKSAPILVRSGRRSFYSTLLPSDESYIRYDTGCIEAVCDRGRLALSLLADAIGRTNPARHLWRAGDVLVIDNWRTLHGRENAEKSSGRKLARMIVDAR